MTLRHIRPRSQVGARYSYASVRAFRRQCDAEEAYMLATYPGADDRYVECQHCGGEMDWEECDACGGEGYFDWDTLGAEDPLWYDPGDTETCDMCNGKGGAWWCSNRQCPAKAS